MTRLHFALTIHVYWKAYRGLSVFIEVGKRTYFITNYRWRVRFADVTNEKNGVNK